MHDMRCVDFESQLERAVESRQQPDRESLERHALTCRRCKLAWVRFQLLERAIDDWQHKAIDVPDLIESIHTTLQSPTTPDHTTAADPVHGLEQREVAAASQATVDRRAQGRGVLAVVVAVLVFMVLAPLQLAPRNPIGEPVTEIKRQPSNNIDQQRKADSLIHDTKSAYLVLAHNTAQAVTDVAILIPVETNRSANPIDPVDAPNLIDQWERDLAPIGKDVGNVFQFLVKAIPFPKT